MLQASVKQFLFGLLVCLPFLYAGSRAQAQAPNLSLEVDQVQTSTGDRINVTGNHVLANTPIGVTVSVVSDGAAYYNFQCSASGGTLNLSGGSNGNDINQTAEFIMPPGQPGYGGGLPGNSPPVQFWCYLNTPTQSSTTGYITVP